MAEYIPTQLTFSRLLSHIFPGIVVALGIVMLVYVMFFNTCVNGEFVGKIQIFEDWNAMLAAFAGIIFFGTIIGVVVDSLHQKIEHIVVNMHDSFKAIEEKEKEVFKDLDNKPVSFVYFIGFLPLERLHFLNDDWYCYIEFEFNMFISFFFSAFIYSYLISILGYNLLSVIIVFHILIILSIYSLWSGIMNLRSFKMCRVDFIKGALEGKYKMGSFQPKGSRPVPRLKNS